jgi:glycosyltransferase involved in cell wall biosynthesis
MDSRDMVDFAYDNLKVRLRTTWFRAVQWLAARLADGQTAITPRMAELVQIPAQQLWGIWPSGVNPEPFAATRPLRRWPEGDEPIHLAYIGIFLEKRYLLPLARAVKQANEEGMSFLFSLYGDGPFRPALEAFAAQSDGAVRVEQPIPHERVPQVLAAAHVGVTSLPEVDDVKYEASSPIKMFEYMAAGMPVLATSNKCHTDVVGNGRFAFWANDVTEAALLVALRQLWQQRRRLAELGQEASVGVDAWTYAANAKKLQAALRQGLSRRSPSRPRYEVGAESQRL